MFFNFGDVDNCCNRLRLVPWLRVFSRCPANTLWELGLDSSAVVLDGPAPSLDEPLYPTAVSVSVGCSWSLHWSQQCGEQPQQHLTALQGSLTLGNCGNPCGIRLGANAVNELFNFLFVDNLIACHGTCCVG